MHFRDPTSGPKVTAASLRLRPSFLQPSPIVLPSGPYLFFLYAPFRHACRNCAQAMGFMRLMVGMPPCW